MKISSNINSGASFPSIKGKYLNGAEAAAAKRSTGLHRSSPVVSKPAGSKNNVSFKAVYLENACLLGSVSEGKINPRFMTKDAILINEIAARYPNQDCFIGSGYFGMPMLQYREKPVEVQKFMKNLANEYTTSMDPNDPDNPVVTLLLDDNTPFAQFYGLPSYVSLNPSLPFTVQAGYEVHKKLLEKKYQILDSVGKNDIIDFGDKTVTEMAHEAIADVETAVKRYLMESSYAALTDKASAKQLYDSNYLKVQTRLQDKRRIDLTTSYVKQDEIRQKSLEKRVKSDNVDICDLAMKKYPNMKENQERIDELAEYMNDNKIFLA